MKFADSAPVLERLSGSFPVGLPYDRPLRLFQTMTTDRVSISLSEQKILFARSGNLCAFRGCIKRLVEEGTAEDNAAVTGVIAHIVGASREGPRGSEGLTAAERAEHTNLILLCPDHHAVIDAQHRTYSVQVLRQMKADHETRVARLRVANGPADSLPLEKETLYSSLMPLTHLPALIFSAETPYSDAQYDQAKEKVRYPHDRGVLVPFLLRDGRLFTFFDMRRKWHPFKDLVRGAVTETRAQQWWTDPEGARRYVTLLNRAMHKLTGRGGIDTIPHTIGTTLCRPRKGRLGT